MEADEPFTSRLGTTCSGSEISYTVVSHLEAAFKSQMQINLQLKHVFVSEGVWARPAGSPRTQTPPFIFLDVNDLSAPEGSIDFRTNKKGIPLH